LDRSKGSKIGGNNWLVRANPPISKDSNPLYDEIHNIWEPNIQVEPIFDTYHGEGDPMAHINDFEMKFELKFRVDDNLMVEYFLTTFRGDALNWYFSLSIKSIILYT